MESLNKYINEYKKQIENGDIKKAYKGLMDFIMDLRIHLKNRHPDYIVSGSIYHGYMDITFFYFTPQSLKNKKLKIAIVFIHEKCRFEVWFAGNNRQIQAKYRQLLQDINWNKYKISPEEKGVDLIIESVLVDNPDFDDLNSLTNQIEMGVLKFIEDIQYVLD
ncbi:DUF7000 family protein [Abyssisolibacter fermentans]|uniref:DUF7000 family protein n=1 Tax=Abyssisolibacter fermentans TaxID=1766203 RepID=UPI000836641C|nr:hypothetical protein [Abyssisolibacter fermentans]